MMIGLIRGTIELAEHSPEWEMFAAQTIERLRDVFGRRFVEIEPIDIGLSKDKKYRAATIDQQRFFLRISDISKYEHKKNEYERMQYMNKHKIPMPRPVDFGVCDSGGSVYQLLTWCDGEVLETILPDLSESEQYAVGIKSGEILRNIHSVPVKTSDIAVTDWNARYSSFIDESIADFHKCGVKVDGANIILNYFDDNRSVLETRPQCYMHGDYHTSNMMISPDLELTVIDWELQLFDSYGDPWKEIAMQKTSKHFSTGKIHGYFCGEPPADYWHVLMFYRSIETISSIPWAFYKHPEFLDSLVKRTAEVLEWHDNMNNPIPTWYLKDFYVH